MKVGWVDVPDIDWGDFRCRRAVYISSYIKYLVKQGMMKDLQPGSNQIISGKS